MIPSDDEAVSQAANDCIGILDNAGLNFWESLGVLKLIEHTLITQTEVETRERRE